MKRALLILILNLSIQISHTQEIFSDAFSGIAPFAIEAVNDELYISLFDTSEVYKINPENPEESILVTELSNYQGLGSFRLHKKENTNQLYGFLITSQHFVIDLDQEIPATEVVIASPELNNPQRGILERDDLLYSVGGNPNHIRRVVFSDLNSTPEVVYSSNEDNPTIILAGFFNNNLYFFEKIEDTYTLFSINPANLNEVPTAISVMSSISSTGFNLIQDAFVRGDYVYFSLNASMVDGIYKINLNQNDPQVDLITAINGDIIGITSLNNYLYYVSNQLINRIEDSSLSIQDVVTPSQVSMFPNPAKNQVQIFSENQHLSKIEIYDLSGRLVMRHNYTSAPISISSLRDGIYLVKFFNNEGIIDNHRLIKQ